MLFYDQDQPFAPRDFFKHIEMVATNDLGEPIYASLAVSNGEIFVRTWANLYCVSAKK